MKHYKEDTKLYYICIKKENNSVLLTTTKTSVAKFIGISVDTLNRRLNKTPSYTNEKYSVWCNVSIQRCKKGFGL